jgi:ankyrin repeat protein
MAEIKSEDLKPVPFKYQSSRPLHTVLVGEDTAITLIKASSEGDIAAIQTLLEQPSWIEIALESPHYIYSEDRPAKDKDDVRGVLAMKKMNLDRALSQAASNGHAEVVTALLKFAARHNVKPINVVDREAVKACIEKDRIAVFEALVAADPNFATFNYHHEQRPLDIALSRGSPEMVEAILKAGGGRKFPIAGQTEISYPSSRLAKSSNKAKIELLVQHGYTIKGSGALQMAADRGALDTITWLVEHGADVSEILPAETLPRFENAILASWTPMHFAARWRREEAMKLLENLGADPNIVDSKGRTPAQLLEERKAAVAAQEAKERQ